MLICDNVSKYTSPFGKGNKKIILGLAWGKVSYRWYWYEVHTYKENSFAQNFFTTPTILLLTPYILYEYFLCHPTTNRVDEPEGDLNLT